jgi:hypothetical protein
VDLLGRLRLALTEVDSGLRFRSLRALAELLRVCLEYVVHHRAAVEHGIDVVCFWCDRALQRRPANPWAGLPRDPAADEAVLASRRQLLGLASEADQLEDRAAWLCIQGCAELAAAALEPLTDLSAARGLNAARYILDAMAWPDDDPEARAQAEARLLALLQALQPPRRH